MSVNLSGKQICRLELVPKIRQLLAETKIRPNTLILEITETVMIHSAEATIQTLQSLKAMGVRLHMDDFGTGYSSLSCLHRFPLTGLKIEQNFVKSASENRDYAAIVHAIVSLAKNLGMSLVAEGIETADQLALLLAMDCDEGQGYYFSKPLEAADALEYLRGKKIAESRPLLAAG
jgi:EAL domain-containing protein (putative c-di-GMP-specific phosphodiesterase class I)